MTTEPIETLYEIVDFERFCIEKLGHLGPFGPEIDRVCYHLHEDLDDEDRHQDQDEVYGALVKAGVEIDRDALADYPWEIWEERWPTIDWLENHLPKMFDVLNSFSHGIYAVSYEPKGPIRGLYNAAFRDAWDNADPMIRPPGCESEDLSKKAALAVFQVRLDRAVYQCVKEGRLTLIEAAKRVSRLQDDIRARWPRKLDEAERLLQGFPFATPQKFSKDHQELLDWAIWSICSDEKSKAN
ncbi:hypothetical protein [Qipengyuania mesophila]|uniref:hypothetical protein n=1 Tax=Qipengyuania mesophila TaxID=2867246 RepID=UPI003514C4F9